MSAIAVRLENISKFYKLYDSKRDRLREALDPWRRKRHREFFALSGVDLEVKKGEILGIVGRNGAGKSTLLKLLAGVIQPSSGRMAINGNISAMLELGSGLNPDLDGIQNIYFGGIMLGFSREQMKEKLDQIVAFADIGNFIRQPMHTYSSGMKARLGFALAIHMKPEILIVDEVLSVGDDLFRRKCFSKIEALFASGCTVFFVSHNVANIVEICTRAVLLDKGEIILSGSPKLVTMNYLKLMFAAHDEQNSIRSELLRLNRDEEKKKEFAASLKPEKENLSTQEISNAFFIPDFKPKSTVVIKNDDVNIYDMQIKTLDGREVNALVMNEEYIYSYKVEFGIILDNVNFGMGFKNEKGLALSWMIYPGINKYLKETIYQGDIYNIKWRFKCLFTPGNHFIDSAVRTLMDDKPTLLAKFTDALAFKVLDESQKQKGGLFASVQEVEVERL